MEEENKSNVKQKIFICIGIVVLFAIAICFVLASKNIQNNTTSTNLSSETTINESATKISSEYDNINYGGNVSLDESKNLQITAGGTYDLTGSYESITINTTKAVQLNLNEVEITNENGPAINVENAETVNIVLTGKNKITSTTTEELDGAIYSKDDIIFSGDGSIEIKSNYDGIVSKDTLVIKSGTYVINSDDDGIRGKDSVAIVDGTFTINAGGTGIKSTNDEDTTKGYVAIDNGTFTIDAVVDGIHANGNLIIKDGSFKITSKDDAIHADGLIEINNGTYDISAAEGIEATYVKINDGTININASDDGINAGKKTTEYTPTVEINGGTLTIVMGQGDTDGIDSNGNLYINGGTIDVTSNSPFDYDGTAEYNGGKLIVNGSETDTITNQFGGGMNGGMNFDKGGRQQMNGNGENQMTPPTDMNGEMPLMGPNGDNGNVPPMDQNGEMPAMNDRQQRQDSQNGNFKGNKQMKQKESI